jgi:hypothetical protein
VSGFRLVSSSPVSPKVAALETGQHTGPFGVKVG